MGDDVVLRSISDDEFPRFVRAVALAFGDRPGDDELTRRRRAVTDLGRSIVATEGDDIVGTALSHRFELTLPGGAGVPVAAVTAVGVRPTHRRRGVLRSMMAAQLDDVAARGEVMAVLTASEGGIYGRFGYGVATSYADWVLTVDDLDLDLGLVPRPRDAGRLRLVEVDDAVAVVADVADRARRHHPGQLGVSTDYWDLLLHGPPDGGDDGPLFVVVHDGADGTPDGVAVYRVRSSFEHGTPNGTAVLEHLHAVDDEVEAVLLRFLAEIDLVRSVRATGRPLDEPLRWRLADPRRLRVDHVGDHLWARVLDVGAALGARRYAGAGRLVVELHDPFRPGNDGCWAVEGGPDGATAARATDEPDLALGAAELATLLLGGVPPSVLARAGRVEERRPGALRRADAFLAPERAPWCSIDF